MPEYRLGDDLDDFCVKCKRITNHSLLAMVDHEPAKLRCRSCYHEHSYRHSEPPPSRKEQQKSELFKAVLSSVTPESEASAPTDAKKKKH